MTSHFDTIKPGGILVYPFTAQLSNEDAGIIKETAQGQYHLRRIRAEKRKRGVTSDKESASQTNALVMAR